MGIEYELWVLNPIIDVIHETAIIKPPRVNVFNLIKDLKNSKEEFIPKWSNLSYWFPEDFIPVLSRAWGFAHSLDDEIKYTLLVPVSYTHLTLPTNREV